VRINVLIGGPAVAPFQGDTLQLVLRSDKGAWVNLGAGFEAGEHKKCAGSFSIARMSP